jgi:integrase
MTPPKGLRPAEWKALHVALCQIDQDAADFALFLAWTGWRFSEAAALSSYDVEDYGDSLYVTMGR